MKAPYLVQRGKLAIPPILTNMDSLVKFDYMGSSEFEFGALPKALKEMRALEPELICDQISSAQNLWVLCKKEDLFPLIDWWDKVFHNKYSVGDKEVLWYDRSRTNFWWDIENNWMATIGSREIEMVRKVLKRKLASKC